MLKKLGIHKGVNLGGWLSQCDYSEERLNNFITEADFQKIATWGFDHVRIPIDYNVIQNTDGSMKESGLQRIDTALALCEKYGLRTVLDLHKTPGFSFDKGEQEAGFFENILFQKAFYTIWETMAVRYGSLHERVVFELLNEVTEERFLPAWKRISRECVCIIRKYAPDTCILLGSWNWNSARTLPDLDPPYDDKVVYNFHFYEPLCFTHQGAYWNADIMDITKRCTYAESGVDPAWMEKFMTPAFENAEQEGVSLYCGEYGVIDVVPPEEALKWFHDVHKVFERHGIAHSVWSWKEMDFGIQDARMDSVRNELLKIL